jgi:hypothetical protein
MGFNGIFSIYRDFAHSQTDTAAMGHDGIDVS